MKQSIITENKRGLFNYQVLEKWLAGIKLTGPEVKTVKSGQINLSGSFVTIKTNSQNGQVEAWLVGAQIPPYKKAGYSQNRYQPAQDRKLLLKRRELDYLLGKTKQKGLTIIPTLVYTQNRLIKMEIALCQGKKKFDKRETIKKREFERRKQRLLQR
ncbi:MAG: SsrA-binding protein [Candidatus Komeilibacteria bacterium RIFCSPLOWO2_01_FULL_45_10]|uniref:SsrA-binding protein n=1 Tax=Candidatus Komeilibacteria bacterium RIFCSPLOWO2_01_FULL_45_10 TaxID=1798550 RepID=A0A1G2BIY8_9BACT|nr:MAG: SsrA-binding protein [Candidatus Komeilibacteria bacterium RIFCSPLOWO2_01_FULL_45_10]